MPDLTPHSSRHEIGTIIDCMATEALIATHQTFESVVAHRDKAFALMANIDPVVPEDVHHMMMLGPLAYASPAFGKLVFNSGRRMLAAIHLRVAQRSLPS